MEKTSKVMIVKSAIGGVKESPGTLNLKGRQLSLKEDQGAAVLDVPISDVKLAKVSLGELYLKTSKGWTRVRMYRESGTDEEIGKQTIAELNDWMQILKSSGVKKAGVSLIVWFALAALLLFFILVFSLGGK